MLGLVEQLSILLVEKNWKVVTAESCTAGLISASITHRPGSSALFDRGFATYSNEAKQDCLGVSSETLEKHGAVSQETASEMARGALKNSNADISLSVTGIAGPDGGTQDKPVGLVYFGLATRKGCKIYKDNFSGNREEIRTLAAKQGIRYLIKHLEEN